VRVHALNSTDRALHCQYKKLRYRRGTELRAMLVNSCYVSRDMAEKRYRGFKQQKWPSRSSESIGNGAIR